MSEQPPEQPPERPWPADQVSRWPIEKLIPYARNSRLHSDAQIAQLCGSLKEWGWTIPVLVGEDGVLIAGHARVMAARRLGIKQIPTMVAVGWSEAQKRAYVIADNKLAMNATFSTEMLVQELGDIASDGFDLELVGFNQDEMDALLSGGAPNGGLTEEDDAPALATRSVSEPGDVWTLGRHRLICGDCTDPLVVKKLLNGVTPHLMVTDPPYGVDYDPTARRALQSKNSKAAVGRVKNDDRADWSEAWGLFPGEVAYVWHGERQLLEMGAELRTCGFELRNLIVWAKSNLVVGRGHYHSQHETCWYSVRKGATGHWAGDRKQTTLWQIDKPAKSETGHSTQKPVDCMRRPVLNNSNAGQAVYDPFSGSGTTIIACETTGRAALAIEIDPLYVDLAVRRWQAFSGGAAVLDGDGRAFDDIAAQRLG